MILFGQCAFGVGGITDIPIVVVASLFCEDCVS